jgi:hypothetical protein
MSKLVISTTMRVDGVWEEVALRELRRARPTRGT